MIVNMSKKLIEHQGFIKSIQQESISVVIAQDSACSACAAASLCHASNQNQKTIEVTSKDAGNFHVGQQVTVIGEVGLGLRATLWAYIVPLSLLMGVLTSVISQTGNEALGALAALLSLALYYVLLFMFRGKVRKFFSFRIVNAY